MGAYEFPFAEAVPRVSNHANDFLFHESVLVSRVVDTYETGRTLNSVVTFARLHELPVSTYVAGGRNTGTGCKYSARLQMALTLAR